VDVALTIHFYEAVLACLAIVVWHFYHVIFDPDVYPMNPAFWDGRVSKEWVREEHPLDPQASENPACLAEPQARMVLQQPSEDSSAWASAPDRPKPS